MRHRQPYATCAAHMCPATRDLILTGEPDRQTRWGRIDPPLEFKERLAEIVDLVVTLPCPHRNDPQSNRGVLFEDQRRIADPPAKSLLPNLLRGPFVFVDKDLYRDRRRTRARPGTGERVSATGLRIAPVKYGTCRSRIYRSARSRTHGSMRITCRIRI